MNDFSLEPYFNCQDVNNLEHIIDLYATKLTKWSISGYATIVHMKMPLRQFVSVKGYMLTKLDFSKPFNRTFIIQLYDVCCTLSLSSPATVLYNIIVENQLLLGSRLEAAMMVLCSYGSNDEYAEAFLPICEKLHYAIQYEEDNEWPCISVFIRYYAKIVRDLPSYISYIRNQISQNTNRFSFLGTTPIGNALAINTTNTERAYAEIISILSSTIQLGTLSVLAGEQNVVKSKGEYETRLALCAKKFSEVRSLSHIMIEESIGDSDAVFNSLGRGVRVLTSEEQLLVYMHAYGLMHEAKLKTALEKIPFDELCGNINVVDWGCGQAIATMVLLEFLQSNYPHIHIEKVLLIEPSAIALERAKLHIRHFDASTKISVINKGFDAITPPELQITTALPIMHLFSNILDYEGFELSHLESLVDSKSDSLNYIVCSSPMINETKTARLYSFEQYFSMNIGYTHLYDVQNTAGTWLHNWTRVLRVFKYGK